MTSKGKAPAGTNRPRRDRVYQNKGKVQELLGFDTEKAFDTWRTSPLVKPWWDIYVASDKSQEAGRKVLDEGNLLNRIREGERLGKMRYSAAMKSPKYNSPEDYHAWLVFWLAEWNAADRNGCFWSKRLDKYDTYSAMHAYVLWAKRQRHRDAVAATKKPNKAKKATSKELESEEEELETEAESEELDPEKGVALIKWIKGMPDELEGEDNADRIVVDRLCSHSMPSLWKAVDEGFNLAQHLQRRTWLGTKHGSTLREAQVQANKDPGNKRIIFYLETEAATTPEEAQPAPESNIPMPEGDAVREAAY